MLFLIGFCVGVVVSYVTYYTMYGATIERIKYLNGRTTDLEIKNE